MNIMDKMNTKNKFTNISKVMQISNDGWNKANELGLLNLSVKHIGNSRLESVDGNQFINMCSCSYLGLETHPYIVQKAADAVLKAGTVNLPTSRLRIRLSLLDEAEAALAGLFKAKVLTTTSCAAASEAILPLIASGVFTKGVRPLMIFDKFCHFSMNIIKSICGDETEVITAPHNDLDFIEDACKNNDVVAYVADGAYSMGGHAPVSELLKLQDKYGLFLYFDDAHSISAYGKNGVGYVKSHIDELNDRTIVVASLSKAFGACGAMIMFGPQHHYEIAKIYGGPLLWSQYITPAGLGAIIASTEIHYSEELVKLQNKLQENIEFFDNLMETKDSNTMLPIRVIVVNDREMALEKSQRILEKGFYTSAIFFPIVPKNKAGLRIMVRADLSKDDIRHFVEVVKEECSL